MIRTKFRVGRILFSGSNRDEKFVEKMSVSLFPVFEGSRENDKLWGKFSASGEIKLEGIDPEVAKGLKVGREYYIDFSAA